MGAEIEMIWHSVPDDTFCPDYDRYGSGSWQRKRFGGFH
jgi:hypothetical protein